MRVFRTTLRRVLAAIVVTAVVPLVAASFFTQKLMERVSETAFQPEFGAQLDASLGVYQDLAKALKQGMRAEGAAIARSPELAAALVAKDETKIDAALAHEMAAHPSVVSLSVRRCEGDVQAMKKRDAPIDPTKERSLEVRDVIGDDGDCKDDGSPFTAVATLVTPRARFDELESAESFTRAYHQIENVHRGEYLDATYVHAFEALLAASILAAVLLGFFVARPVTKRITRLAEATQPVAEGDLTVRVDLEGHDEIADLGRAFNRMLEELDESRARVEFLKRMSEFQKIARRLAHEIKNPLTPIQLAVEEAHRRYRGDDAQYRKVVDTMHEVVEEEIGSLRRLVSEFSSFARLPRADLAKGDLAAFLRDQETSLEATQGEGEDAILANVALEFVIEDEPMPAALDREMLHRVVANVVRNAAQALRDAQKTPKPRGKIVLSAHRLGDGFAIDIDDDGPGIPPEIAASLFDPYVTTKRDGTGLGLSIVKKIAVDHGGTIEALASPLGGARFRLRIPREGTPASRAAIERSTREFEAAPSSR